MTRLLLIKAGPTAWDVEQRIAGSHTLPLTDEARTQIRSLVETLPAVDAVYCCKSNDACEDVAKMIAARNKLRPRDNAELDAWCVGLWEGLRLDDLRQRYPKVIQQWETAPATVVPPEGESFGDAISRLRDATRKLLHRHRGRTVALALRPTAKQIVSGILHGQTPEQIAVHLQIYTPMETIELEEEVLKSL